MWDSRERPGGINHRPGRTIYARWEPEPRSRGAKRTNRAVKTLTEWASAGAEPWGPVPFLSRTPENGPLSFRNTPQREM